VPTIFELNHYLTALTWFSFLFLQSSVLGSGGIMYINGRIVSGPLDSLIETLLPKDVVDLDKVGFWYEYIICYIFRFIFVLLSGKV